MGNTKHAARDGTLADLAVGEPALIVGVDGADADRLVALGFRPGPRLIVEGDAPFRGPRIVRLGGARIALARSAAKAVRVRTQPTAILPATEPR